MSIYFILLLIMVILLYDGIASSVIYAPRKIKVMSVIALVFMTFRYIALIILFIMENQNYLYLLKPLVFTNLMCIPLCGILSVIIFSRDNKIKLKKILLIFTILCVAYGIVIYKSPATMKISELCGYTIDLQLEVYCYIVFLISNVIFAIKGIELFNKTYSNKIGALLIILSSTITIIAVLITSINTNFHWLVLGDISWIITIDYGLKKLKR